MVHAPTDTAERAARLRAEKMELANRIRSHLHRSDDPALLALAGQLPDADDHLTSDMLMDLNVATLGLEISGLREIEVALNRIRVGTYGICTDCGQPIDPARLDVQPAARLCLACKQIFETRRGFVTHLPAGS